MAHAALLVVVMVDEGLDGPVEVTVHFPQRQARIAVAAHHPSQRRVVLRLDGECIRQASGGQYRDAPDSVVACDRGNNVIANRPEEDV